MPLPIFDDLDNNVLAVGTFKCALIVIQFVGLDPRDPHRGTALGALGIFAFFCGREMNTPLLLLQAGVRVVSQPPTPVGRASAGDGR